MAINWIKILGYVGTGLSVASLICNNVNQNNAIKEAAQKAVEEALKTKN